MRKPGLEFPAPLRQYKVSVPLPGFSIEKGIKGGEPDGSRVMFQSRYRDSVLRKTQDKTNDYQTRFVSVPLPGFSIEKADNGWQYIDYDEMFQSRYRDSVLRKIKKLTLRTMAVRSFSPVTGIQY